MISLSTVNSGHLFQWLGRTQPFSKSGTAVWSDIDTNCTDNTIMHILISDVILQNYQPKVVLLLAQFSSVFRNVNFRYKSQQSNYKLWALHQMIILRMSYHMNCQSRISENMVDPWMFEVRLLHHHKEHFFPHTNHFNEVFQQQVKDGETFSCFVSSTCRSNVDTVFNRNLV
jgi:hypothetical protein